MPKPTNKKKTSAKPTVSPKAASVARKSVPVAQPSGKAKSVAKAATQAKKKLPAKAPAKPPAKLTTKQKPPAKPTKAAVAKKPQPKSAKLTVAKKPQAKATKVTAVQKPQAKSTTKTAIQKPQAKSGKATVTQKPQPKSAKTAASKKPQPKSTKLTAVQKPQPKSTKVTAIQKPQPKSTKVTAIQKPQPKSDKVTAIQKPQPESDNVTAIEKPQPKSTKVTVLQKTQPESTNVTPIQKLPTKQPMNIIKKAVQAISAVAKAFSDTPKKPLGEVSYTPVTPEVAQKSMEGLRQRYPDADCELTFKSDFELLIAVILSAQTTDVNVNKVTPKLFYRYPTPKALAEAKLDDIKDIIRSTGFFNNKAINIQACAHAIVTKFGSKVPSNIEDLTKLPGVGRKTANVLLGVIHKIPSWTVDTHVQRLSKRLGYSNESEPEKIEMELQALFPDQDWTKDSITLIWHGRRCCYARNPDCGACPVNKLCPSSQV